MQPNELVDLARYPIDQPDSAAGVQLVAQCRAALDESALCALPGFIHSQAVAAMAEEIADLSPRAYALEMQRVAYIGDDNTWPADHPRNVEHTCRYGQILTDDIPAGCRVHALYHWPALTEFVRRALGEETLYQSACPHFSLTVQVSGAGDRNGWHYDPNDYVVSLLVQAPDAGGEFEYAPYIRSTDDENYGGVSRLFADPDRHAIHPPFAPGTFVLFKGDLSLHRVRAVEDASRDRMIALFSYHHARGQVFPVDYADALKRRPRRGRSAAATLPA